MCMFGGSKNCSHRQKSQQQSSWRLRGPNNNTTSSSSAPLPSPLNLYNLFQQQQQQQPVSGPNMSNMDTTYWTYTAPETLDGVNALQLYKIARPILLQSSKTECAICLDDMKSHDDYEVDKDKKRSAKKKKDLSASSPPDDEEIADYQPCFRLLKCGHAFHLECLLESMQSSSACPLCRTPLAEPRGKSPSGRMSVRRLNELCPGFGSLTLSIQYRLHGGVQKAYHEHPGVRYQGDSRMAYLPDTVEGHKLLKRLVYAFCHGLTFRIGTSLTSGRSDQVVWASIHHKTSLSRGPHGFPDPSYLQRCHEELNQVGVPDDPPMPKSD